MATRSIGLPWQTLEQLNQDELFWEQQVLSFRDLRVLWQQQGVLPMLRKLLATFKVPARLLVEDQGERRLTNLLHLAEWLQRSAAELDGEHALIRHLAEQVDGQSEEEILRLESDSDLIKVITVHKSKGLEYPLVLLPFACSAREIDGKSKTPPMFHDENDSLVIELVKGESAKPAQLRANDERMGEEMRLLYVALTRARYATWICMAAQASDRRSKTTHLHKTGLGYMLAGEKQVTPDELLGVVETFAKNCNDIDVRAAPSRPTMSRSRQLHRRWGRHCALCTSSRRTGGFASYSALAIADGNVLMGAQPGDDLEPATALGSQLGKRRGRKLSLACRGRDWLGSLGRRTGTFLHGLFEWAGREGFAKAAGDPITLHNTVRRCNLRDWGNLDRATFRLAGQLSEISPLRFNSTDCELSTLRRLSGRDRGRGFPVESVNVQRLDAFVESIHVGWCTAPQYSLPTGLNGMFKGFIEA